MPRFANFLTTIVALFGIRRAHADVKLDVVATFSILGDFVENVGGDCVFVNARVDPGSLHARAPLQRT
jgi:zinc/manganese transport system substrate-binding protein